MLKIGAKSSFQITQDQQSQVLFGMVWWPLWWPDNTIFFLVQAKVVGLGFHNGPEMGTYGPWQEQIKEDSTLHIGTSG